MRSSAAWFWRDESAVTSVEYGLIMALIAVLLIVVMSATGASLAGLWLRIGNCLATSAGADC